MSHNSVAHPLCGGGVYFRTSVLQSFQSIGAVSNIFCLHQLLAADSSSSNSNVVCCLFVVCLSVIKLENYLLTAC